jgi:hypothetical protein
MYVRTQSRRGLGRRLGQSEYDFNPDTGTFPVIPAPSSGQSSWDLAVNAVLPNEATSLALGTQQIASPYQNALNANAAAIAAGLPAPYTPEVLAAIQAAITTGTTAFQQENADIWNYSKVSTWPWYYWAAIAVGSIWAYGQLKK